MKMEWRFIYLCIKEPDQSHSYASLYGDQNTKTLLQIKYSESRKNDLLHNERERERKKNSSGTL